MKNYIFCLLGLLLLVHSSPLISQISQEITVSKVNWNYYLLNEENKRSESNVKNGLKEQRIKYNSGETVYKYDNKGRVIEYSSGKRKHVITYDNDIQKKSILSYKKNKLFQIDSFKWNGANLLVASNFNANYELKERETYQYDSTYVTEYKFEKTKGHSFKEFRKSVYEYYPDHSYKKITYYKKGKAKKYSVFDCDPRGIEHKAKRDSAFNCVKYDVDSLGNKIKVSITNQKGYAVKVIDYYNDKDKLIATKTYDIKKGNALLWAYTFTPGYPYYTSFVSYVRNKVFYEVRKKRDERDNCLESTTYKRGKLKRRETQQFNEKGLLLRTNHYNRRNKLKGATTYTYEYY